MGKLLFLAKNWTLLKSLVKLCVYMYKYSSKKLSGPSWCLNSEVGNDILLIFEKEKKRELETKVDMDLI